MRAWYAVPGAVLFPLVSACTPTPAPQMGEVLQNRAHSPEPEPERAAESTSCAVVGADVEPIEFSSAVPLGEVADKRWLVTHDQASDAGSLLHLDPRGQLAVTPLPTWSEYVAVEGGRILRFLDPYPEPKWWTVDLSSPDAPKVSDPRPVEGLVAGQYPKGFASDGSRALVAMYRQAPGTSGYIGDSALYAVPSGARVTALAPMAVWAATCDTGQCFGLASANPGTGRTDDRLILVRFADGTTATMASWSDRCVGWSQLRVGRQWLWAWSRRDSVDVHVLDVDTGRLRSLEPVPASQICSDVTLLRMSQAGAEHVGLLIGQTKQLLRPMTRADDGAWTVGAPHSWPKNNEDRRQVAVMADGVLIVDASSRSGMEHGPPDANGIRWYHDTYSYSASAAFVRWRAGAWSESDRRPLPHSGEEGQFSSGYRTHVLTRPGYAMALVLGDGFTKGVRVLLRAPCRRE